MASRMRYLMACLALLVAACGSQTVDPSLSGTAGPTATATAPTSETFVRTSATPSPTSSASPTTPTGGSATLEVEGFADVVADRLQVRAAPGLNSDVVEISCYGYPEGADRCPPLILGRGDSPWQLTSVYLLEGPVEADGYEWYLVATESKGTLYWDYVGWVAAGDTDDAWLIPRDTTCPDEPIELADVTFTANSPLTLLYCLGGREITLRGYYTDPQPGEPLEGDCVSEPAWLVCTWGGHILRVEAGTWVGDGNHLQLHLHPDMGPMPPRPGWIEVTGQFDHPAAAECGDGQPASDPGCRVEFVVTSARPAE